MNRPHRFLLETVKRFVHGFPVWLTAGADPSPDPFTAPGLRETAHPTNFMVAWHKPWTFNGPPHHLAFTLLLFLLPGTPLPVSTPFPNLGKFCSRFKYQTSTDHVLELGASLSLAPLPPASATALATAGGASWLDTHLLQL